MVLPGGAALTGLLGKRWNRFVGRMSVARPAFDFDLLRFFGCVLHLFHFLRGRLLALA